MILVMFMVSITWYGTFSLKLENNNEKILIDPFIRYNKRKDKSFKNNFLDTKDIFITHGHLDHTMDLPMLYKNEDVKIYTTKTPYNRLINDGIKKDKLVNIKYGDKINIGNINITVLHGKHIKFDAKLVLKTIFNKNMFKYSKNLPKLIKAHLKCKENKETVNYFIKIKNLELLFMGSMGINKYTTYPKNIDYLILAYQGRSDLERKIDEILDRINPKNIILAHFDNSFPPISSEVDVDKLKNKLSNKTNLIIPKYEEKIILKDKQ